MSSSTTSVFPALIGDLLVAACKTVAAVWTGSAAMMSEAIHSFVDTTSFQHNPHDHGPEKEHSGSHVGPGPETVDQLVKNRLDAAK